MRNFVKCWKNEFYKLAQPLLIVFIASFWAVSAQAQVQRPKLVVGIMVDQMRWDYLYYYYNDFQQGGLRRLVDEGYSFENTMINYVPTVTAIGHSSVWTGSVPALTGIAANNWIEDGKSVYCCQDSTVKSVGSDSEEGQMSPRRMQATTIGDQLHLATDFRSKVVGIALKDRAAILPAGHSADAAYWWDTSAGNFVSSTYYMNALPKWVVDFNKQHAVKPGTNVKTSDQGVVLTFAMAKAALDNEQLGQHADPDLLCISVSSTDAIGHTYSTRGKENKSVYMELDRQLADFLQTLDAKVGRGNYLLFFTADHGAVHNPNFLKQHKIPAGGVETGKMEKSLNEYLQQTLGIQGRIVLQVSSGRVSLDDNLLKAHGVDIARARQDVVDWLLKDNRIRYAVDYDRVEEATIPQPIKERIVNGYFRGRSGDVFFVARPEFGENSDKPDFRGTGHSQWNPYDAHIPFVLMGWHVNKGETSVPVRIVDIAPTICEMLHIQMPSACVGNAVYQN
ncbi:MAG: alkaline phosphatase family protein [Prevotella sp.]|jgi:predicted AlkP superfamily pyrophosphatase or phosphodiesterase